MDKIPPGMEIFLDFGAEYNQYENVDRPNIDDYIKMDEAIVKMVSFFDKILRKSRTQNMSDISHK